ncbi:MAG: exodeoxyribonuclease VII large subunit, partial [Oscillospiraceae bacterium]|nr:exodeoxyribonuclease VII large subunit [Oscillospiraceae bacterium]
MANIITVAALNRYVKTLLDSDIVLTDIAVRGEITNYTHHRSGHLYFSLRDENASVKAVMFRRWAQELAFEPREGMRVILRCRVSLYEQTGAFQLYVEDIFPDGLGSVQMAFEQLKEKLAKEGLFDPERKRPVPAKPRCIGLVTSKTGAAIQDILNVSQRRWPLSRFLLCPVNVQGEDAARQIISAVETLDKNDRVDVILIARGGGSREDLWVFNDEKIARAVCASTTPVVSAVGHEIDYTILDFAADLRAPTPSAAAELLCPDKREEENKICRIYENIHKNMQERLALWYNETERAGARLEQAGRQLLPLRQQAITDKKLALQTAVKASLKKKQTE